jgi:hypothetical protein
MVSPPVGPNPFEGKKMKTKTRSYKGYELTATQNYPKWDVGIYPSGPQLPWPYASFQIFSDADVEKAFEKAERAVDELLGVARPIV